MARFVYNVPSQGELERDSTTDDWDHPEDRVLDTRGRLARSYVAPNEAQIIETIWGSGVATTVDPDTTPAGTPVPTSLLRMWEGFPPQAAREAIAEIFNKDLRNELTDEPYYLTAEELGRVTWVRPDDPRIDGYLSILGINGFGQTPQVSWDQLAKASALLHEVVNPALAEAGRIPDFAHNMRNCSEQTEWEDANAIASAVGCTIKWEFDHREYWREVTFA